MEPQEYDDILRHLVQIAAHQDTINEDLRAMLRTHDALFTQHEAIIDRLTGAIEELKAINAGAQTTLARIETLLARMLRQDENGREA